ncbi:D-arabinose 5-phosphate isomerase KdsD [Azospirillaceae bacterium]
MATTLNTMTAFPSDRASAMRTLAIESEALASLAQSLDESFERALDLLDKISGRVVVTGMGKSGHVARKIAATMASTGAPALYVHPGEASHGDLGMIARNDAVVALSNSGETSELSDILAYTRRFGIPLIAVTSRRCSSLAEQADVLLLLPPAPEACPLGLAPTTSTTMMLALGDAIAISLFERRGFSATDFRELHPGGQLGRALLKVSDIMHGGSALPLARPDDRMSDVLLEMTAKRFGCVGVVDGDMCLIGIITDGDLRRHMDSDLLRQTAGRVMSSRPKAIRLNALAAEALGQMNLLSITSLFVTDGDRLVGILHIHDCLRAGLA